MKNFILLSVVFFISFNSVFSQTNTEAWKYAQSMTENDLKQVLTIIASDQMQGRETGTEGQRRAAIYISNEFKKIGLKAPAGLAGYQQKYILYRDSIVNENVSFGTRPLTASEDFVLMTGDQLSASLNNNQVIFAGYGIDDKNYSDYEGKNVKGKIVIILNGEPRSGNNYIVTGTERNSPWSSFRVNRKIDAATKRGAAAVIFTDFKMEKLPGYLTNNNRGSTLYFPRENGGKSVPLVYALPGTLSHLFDAAQLEKMRTASEKNGPLNQLKIQSKKDVKISFNKKRFSLYASNIIGFVEGSDLKDEYVFLTGHYDHLGMHNGQIYYGADDDGSGTTAVIEMAKTFQKAKNEGHGPRRTIVFMTVSGEEKGLWGSEYYSEHPVFPLDKTTVDLNTDMIGRIDPNRKYGDSTNYLYVIGNDKLSSDLDPIVKNVNDNYLKMELDYKFNDPKDPERIYYRSDHFNFAKKGVPVLFYFDGIHRDYHKPSDTVDKINFDLMLKRVQYVFLTAWEIANRDQMLKRDIPLPPMSR